MQTSGNYLMGSTEFDKLFEQVVWAGTTSISSTTRILNDYVVKIHPVVDNTAEVNHYTEKVIIEVRAVLLIGPRGSLI